MNSQAKSVLWIGLILITVQLVSQWKTIKGIIFTPGAGSTGGASSSAPNIFDPLPSLLSQQTPATQAATNIGSTFPLIGPKSKTG